MELTEMFALFPFAIIFKTIIELKKKESRLNLDSFWYSIYSSYIDL